MQTINIITITADTELGKLAERAFMQKRQYRIRYKGKTMARLVNEQTMQAVDRFMAYEQKLEEEAADVLQRYKKGRLKAYDNAENLLASLDD